jgi:hypothetical protein
MTNLNEKIIKNLIKEIGILLIIISCFISCARQVNTKSKKIINTKTFGIDTSTDFSKCTPKDTMTSFGTKIHFIRHNEGYQISWSNNLFNRTDNNIYTCIKDDIGQIWDNVPRLIGETNKNLIFINGNSSSGGGNPMVLDYYALVLPKNNVDTIIKKMNFIAFTENYLIYAEEFEDIQVLNIDTKKNQKIELNPTPVRTRTETPYFDEINIIKNRLYLKYKTYNLNNDNTYLIKKRYILKI